jgi:hypothetical protein
VQQLSSPGPQLVRPRPTAAQLGGVPEPPPLLEPEVLLEAPPPPELEPLLELEALLALEPLLETGPPLEAEPLEVLLDALPPLPVPAGTSGSVRLPHPVAHESAAIRPVALAKQFIVHLNPTACGKGRLPHQVAITAR